jgi:hypothetical protein
MKRFEFLDLARGVTVFMMAPVHAAMMYSSPVIYDTLLIQFLAFMAEGPGAQLFMTLMGIYIALAKPIQFIHTLERAGKVFIAGYVLNFFKFVIPFWIGIMPRGLLNELQANDFLDLLSIGDIFHFAAIAFVITVFINRFLKQEAYIIILIIIIAIISPVNIEPNNFLFQLLFAEPPHVFFPVIPWLVYPLTGLIIGRALKNDELKTIKFTALFSVVLLLGYCLYRMNVRLGGIASFYRTAWPETIRHISIVGISLAVYYGLQKYIRDSLFFTFLRYSGRNITRIYIIQWIVIMICLPVAQYQQAYVMKTIAWIIFTTTITYCVDYVINDLKTR